MSSPETLPDDEMPPELEEACALDSWRTFREEQGVIHDLLVEEFGLSSENAWLMLVMMEVANQTRLLVEIAEGGTDDDYAN